jgi:tRNA/tmRNA/rRNA uracil-C5-methylase (TrmA/RlmC/RlmD family)
MTGEELEAWIASKEAHRVRKALQRAPAGGPEIIAAPSHSPALGFHIPGIYDKVLDINECHLMSEPSDAIRNEVRRYALERKLPFYDFREHKGFLRTMFVRITAGGEVMVVLVTTDSHARRAGTAAGASRRAIPGDHIAVVRDKYEEERQHRGPDSGPFSRQRIYN